jgi:hypothetical protein
MFLTSKEWKHGFLEEVFSHLHMTYMLLVAEADSVHSVCLPSFPTLSVTKQNAHFAYEFSA